MRRLKMMPEVVPMASGGVFRVNDLRDRKKTPIRKTDKTCMKSFEDISQAMEGLVKRDRMENPHEDYLQYENIVDGRFEWVSMICRSMECWREDDGAVYAESDGDLWLVRAPNVESYRAKRGTLFVANSVLMDSPELKVLELPSTVKDVRVLRKRLRGRVKIYVYINGNGGGRSPRREPELPIRLVKK